MSELVLNNRKAALVILARHLSHRDKRDVPIESASQLVCGLGRYWPDEGVHSREFQTRYPDKELLIRMAEMTTTGFVQFWQPWHMEKTHAPERIGNPVKWTAAPNGDDEWTHALARFTHMFDLAAGYRLSNDIRMFETFTRHLHEFYSARGDEGELWGNRLDAALRLLNLVRAHDLLRNNQRFNDDDQFVCIGLMLRECELLYNGLGTRVGNWEFFITTSFLCATHYLQGTFDVVKWQSDALARLYQIIDSEILEDGNLVEQVPMYHGVCVLALLDFLVLQKANNRALDEKVLSCAGKMVSVLATIADPDGRIPTIGDSDAFDVKYIADYCDCVLRTDHRAEIEKTRQTAADGTPRIRTLTSAGWTVVRWKSRDNQQGYLFFDFSGKPKEGREGHSHADDLQVIFHNGQRPVLVDPGRFTYTSLFLADLHRLPWKVKHSALFRAIYSLARPRFHGLNSRNWNSYFRHTLRHNTISCDGNNQDGYDDSPAQRALISSDPVIAAGPMLLCRATLNSTAHYSHERSLVCQLPHFLMIVDRLTAPEPHNWIASFHFGADVQAVANQQSVRAITADGTNHTLVFADAGGAPVSISIVDDWISPEYNLKVPAKTAQVRISNRADTTLLSVISLDPGRISSQQATIKIRQEADGRATWAEVHFPSDEGDFMCFLRLKGTQINNDGIATDAYYASICRTGKTTTEIGYLDGSYLEVDGKRRATNAGSALHTLTR